MEAKTATSFDSPMEEEIELLQHKVTKKYGSKIIENLKRKQVKMAGEFLTHEIKNSHRKQMIVWMDEVLTIFKCPVETFFMAVHIMDRYFEECQSVLQLSELHEIGIVSMFIASKYQEVEPLTTDLMIEKVAHGKITHQKILEREKKILSTLKFRLGSPNVMSFLDAYLEIFHQSFLSDEKEQIKENSIKVAKKSILERKKAFKMSPCELSLRIIIKTLKGYSEIEGKSLLPDEFLRDLQFELKSVENSPVNKSAKLS